MVGKKQEKTYEKIVIAVDKFKNNLTAIQVAEAISQGAYSFLPSASEVLKFPMADGGEGSLELMETCLNGHADFEKIYVEASDPLGRKIQVPFLLIREGDKKTAFVEMAKVSGLALVPPAERDLIKASTFGLGEVLAKAINDFSANAIILAIGGSATNDGGEGMLAALGESVEGNNSLEFEKNANSIRQWLDKHLKYGIKVACDVRNPLLGKDGATAVYGPQKGGTYADLIFLEERMKYWANIVQKWTGKEEDITLVPGSGAAGGVGFAMHAVLGAELIEGWRLFSEMVGLEKAIALADLVITGEGSFDSQSLSGKLVAGVKELCEKYSKEVWVFCGRCKLEEKEWSEFGIDKVISLDEIDSLRCFSESKKMLSEEIWHRI